MVSAYAYPTFEPSNAVRKKLLLESESCMGHLEIPSLTLQNQIYPQLYIDPARHVSEGQTAEDLDSSKLSHSSR